MNISLPESLRTYIESRVESGAYSTPGEFVRDLIRRDPEQEEIEQKLREALEEPAVPMDKDFWPNLRRTAYARAKASSRPPKASGKR